MITFAVMLIAHTAWAASPIFEGVSARIQLLDARVLNAPQESGAINTVRMVYLVTRQPGVVGKLALKEPRDVLITDRSYREITEAELGRTFEPTTIITDAVKYLQEHSELPLQGVPESGSLIIKVELSGAALPKDAEVLSKLSLGFGGKVEESSFKFTPKIE
jgi:hypothetical protein